jgi:hypothetical protein
MADLGEPYVTVEEMRNYFKWAATQPHNLDDDIADAVASATEEVNLFCGRQFNRSETATPRHYRPSSAGALTVDDFWTLDDFKIESDTGYEAAPWAEYNAAGLSFYPLDGIMDGQVGWPYNELRVSRGAGFHYVSRRSYGSSSILRVTAKWGWEAVPAAVKQATKIIAAQNFRLSDTPLGVAGMEGKFGGIVHVKDMPQVASKLKRYVLEPILVG